VALTTHPTLAPRLKKVQSYTSNPFRCLTARPRLCFFTFKHDAAP